MTKGKKKIAKYLWDGVQAKTSRIPPTFKDSDEEFPAWRYGYIDLDGPFGWRQVTGTVYHDHMIRKLAEYEKITWGEIYLRRHCHPFPIGHCEPEARKRWAELQIDYDTMYQLAMDGECRVFGIRIQHIFYLLWYDPAHKVYKVRKGKYAGN